MYFYLYRTHAYVYFIKMFIDFFGGKIKSDINNLSNVRNPKIFRRKMIIQSFFKSKDCDENSYILSYIENLE